jgi:hypothetical protein
MPTQKILFQNNKKGVVKNFGFFGLRPNIALKSNPNGE